jgi:hypothetical protein
MNSDVGKLYMKIIAFNKIYNFVAQTFFSFEVILRSKSPMYCPDLSFDIRFG